MMSIDVAAVLLMAVVHKSTVHTDATLGSPGGRGCRGSVTGALAGHRSTAPSVGGTRPQEGGPPTAPKYPAPVAAEPATAGLWGVTVAGSVDESDAEGEGLGPALALADPDSEGLGATLRLPLPVPVVVGLGAAVPESDGDPVLEAGLLALAVFVGGGRADSDALPVGGQLELAVVLGAGPAAGGLGVPLSTASGIVALVAQTPAAAPGTVTARGPDSEPVSDFSSLSSVLVSQWKKKNRSRTKTRAAAARLRRFELDAHPVTLASHCQWQFLRWAAAPGGPPSPAPRRYPPLVGPRHCMTP
jgi:hypothetical protein